MSARKIINEASLTRREGLSVTASSMAISRRFNPFDKYSVREEIREQKPKPVLENSLIQRLRKAREMLRALPPEQALELIEFHDNLDFFQAMELAKKLNALIVPNDVIDRILTKIYHLDVHWTGTLVIYKKPNQSFKDKLVYVWKYNKVNYSLTFDIPKQFRGMRNCALVVEHPDYDLENLGDNTYQIRVPDESMVHLVEDFPVKNGWYLSDIKCAISQGRMLEKSAKAARYLYRIPKRAGPAWHGYDLLDGYGGQVVGLDYKPSSGCKVALLPLGKLQENILTGETA